MMCQPQYSGLVTEEPCTVLQVSHSVSLVCI